MVEEDNLRVKGVSKLEGRRFQQSNLSRKASFKDPASGLEDKFFDFEEEKRPAEFMVNCEAMSKFIMVYFKYGSPKRSTSIKKM